MELQDVLLYVPAAALLCVTVSVLHLCPPAIKDYEAAGKHNENDRQIKEGLDRAQRLLKQSQKRDYYKILGVKRWVVVRRGPTPDLI